MRRMSVWIIVALSLLIIGLVVSIAYFSWWQPKNENNPPTVTSFATCVSAGNAVMESFPRRCRDPVTGVTYTESVEQNQTQTPTEQLATRTYTSSKGVTIQLDNWADNKQVTSPLTITGKVPGNWSFEASFPVELLSAGGSIIAQEPASLQGDWMTESMVSFTITLTFDMPESDSTGKLVLRKSNPSDLAANNDVLELPVRYWGDSN